MSFRAETATNRRMYGRYQSTGLSRTLRRRQHPFDEAERGVESVAAISGDEDAYGWEPMRKMLLEATRRYRSGAAGGDLSRKDGAGCSSPTTSTTSARKADWRLPAATILSGFIRQNSRGGNRSGGRRTSPRTKLDKLETRTG